MSAVIWILIGAAVLAALCGGRKGTGARGAGGQGKAIRIDRMHYFDADDHECSACGARFRGKNATVCPRCGARFEGTKEDDGEFIEEMEIWDDDE